jgi:uncharacterized membrane protein YbhN (UPF0104 family)
MSAARVRFALGLLVCAGALWLLLPGVQGDAFAQAWARLSAVGLLQALLLLAAGYTVRVVRWWWMLAAFDTRVRIRDCVTPFETGAPEPSGLMAPAGALS